MSKLDEISPPSLLARIGNKTVLTFPIPVLMVFAAATVFFGYYARHFSLDASSESIILEDDKDLLYYDESRKLFGSDDYVVVTVTPKADLFADETLEKLQEMIGRFESIDSVAATTSILDVPLFLSPPVPLIQMAKGYKTLLADGCDRELARRELVESPLYKDYLISRDGKTTAIQVTFKDVDDSYKKLEARRTELRNKRAAGRITRDERKELRAVEKAYTVRHHDWSVNRTKDIDTIRAIIHDYAGLGDLHLGGVPMIMADIIRYVEKDILVLGGGGIVFILIVLGLIFRELRWVFLPTVTCALTVLFVMGYMGMTEWQATIVTSNFPSLLLVITIAMIMHIIVRYREIHAGYPELSKRELVFQSVRLVAKPCFYTSATTMVGFASLLVSRIPPVMDFGLMMAMGLGIAYILCFVLFPAALMLLPKGKAPPARLAELSQSPVAFFARFTERHGKAVAVGSVALFVFCAIGATRLKVENRFIDYFRKSTPIYQGMTIIDQRLGGTTPLEVVLEGHGKNYWITSENIARMARLHDWLDGLPETGKVISPVTMLRILEQVNNGKPVNTNLIAFIIPQIPEEIARAVLTPYVTKDFSQIRFAMRVQESDRSLRRNKLLGAIREHLESSPDVGADTAHITGVFVLYNNMLQSLFESQIITIGTVYGAIWLMFLILFRSPALATIAIIPNILPVILVLGTLGWLDIPLDIMTIMIAAVTLGIAVDFAIHYVHRFRAEFSLDHDYKATMYRCHSSIGRAIYYTSITIIAGFSILAFSNFIPTVYFGLFTGLAMIVALLASVTLLPLLLITWKPLGPQRS